MSADSKKPEEPRVMPNSHADLAGWPQWIADALAYRPRNEAPDVSVPDETKASKTDERRNIRILSRVQG